MLQVPVGDHDISSLRAGLTGAALLPPAIGDRFREVTGRNLYEILGMTEASGLVSIDPLQGPGGIGSVGWPLPYTRVDILRLNPDGSLGGICGVDEIGVIAIQGDHISPGYRDPKHNDGVIEAGVLNSGDLGYKDADGRIYIAGRSKDLIIRSGHNIDPAMIENAMSTHPAIAIAAAVGMPDAYAGELPVCFAELLPGTDISVEDLQAHARNTIDERPAWPKQIYVVDAIPLTTVGKIYKPALRCDAAARFVTGMLHTELGVPNASVEVVDGGARGMRVTVSLNEDDRSCVAKVEQALAAYLFEAHVRVREALGGTERAIWIQLTGCQRSGIASSTESLGLTQTILDDTELPFMLIPEPNIKASQLAPLGASRKGSNRDFWLSSSFLAVREGRIGCAGGVDA